MAKRAEKGRVHPDCRNASNPSHECTDYCFKIIAKPKKRMDKNDAGTGVSVFEEENRSMAKRAEKGRVHPDCRNASNPSHECTDYCFKIIAKPKKRMDKNDAGTGVSVFEEENRSMAKRAEKGRVHPDCRNASNPSHECTDYCFKIIAKPKKRMDKNDAGTGVSVFEEENRSMAKRAEKGRVHPDCRNASNPSHECTDYCFKIIAKPKKRMDKNDAGTGASVFEEENRSMAKRAEKGRVHPDCRNASNPSHECTDYCFKIIAKPKKRMDKNDAGTGVSVFEEENRSMAKRAEKGRVHPDCRNASNPSHECTDYFFKIIAKPKKRMDKNDAGTGVSVFEEENRSMAKSAEEGRVHPDCRNSSNPYHECTEYCFKIIAEAKNKMIKSDAGLQASNCIVQTDMVTGTIQRENTIDGYEEDSDEEAGAYADIAAMYYANLTGR